MRRRGVMFAVLVALAAGTGAVPAHAALETVIQDDANLIHRPADQVRASMQRIRALGIDRVRLTADWSALTREPNAAQPPAGFDASDPTAYEQERWGGLDQAVRLARESGLAVLIDIGFWAPRWATSDGPVPRARTNVEPAAFADFAVAVARRYSGEFVVPRADPPPPPPPERSSEEVFREALLGSTAPAAEPKRPPRPAPLDRVDQFALWNEPNHPALLMPQWRRGRPASPTIYRRMVMAAYPAAKSVRPDARFLIGNTASMGLDGRHSVAPLRFIREFACVGRSLRPLRTKQCAGFTRVPGDGWAHHPYNRNLPPDARSPASLRDNVLLGDLPRMARLLRRLIVRQRLGPGMRRIHVTEFGYETRRIGTRPKVAPRRQARWLTWAEHLSSRVPGVVSFAQFLLRDQPPAPVRVSNSEARAFGQFYTGLLTADGAEKPAARSFVAGLFAQRRRDGRVLLWGRLRLGAGTKALEIQRRRPDDRWRPLLDLQVDGQSAFRRVVRARRGVSYRLRWPAADGKTVTGLPVRAVRP